MQEPVISSAPVFINPLIGELYKNDLRIDHEIIKNILALPRETLVDDLHKILYDSVERFHYFAEETQWKNETHEFLLHALFILTELRNEQSLPVILDLLRQDEKYLDFWFNDFLTEEFWEMIFWMGMNRLDDLSSFMKEPGVYCYSKTEVAVAVSQIALYYPVRRNEVVDWFRGLFQFFLSNPEDDALINIELISLMVGNVMDFNGSELKEEIIALYENGLAWPGTSGRLEKVLNELDGIQLFNSKRENFTIFSRYDEILSTWECYTHAEENFFKNHDRSQELIPVRDVPKSPKVGRNDPCPCGSGKKFKKCCMEG